MRPLRAGALVAPAVLLSACAPAIGVGVPAPEPGLPRVPAVTPSWRQPASTVPTASAPAVPTPSVPAASTSAWPSSPAPTFDASGRTRLAAAGALPGARLLIAHLAVRGRGPRTGYARANFGVAWSDDVSGVAWGHNGCGTRDDVLARDLDQTSRRGRCVITAGSFVDPYTATAQHFVKARAGSWPIDHLVPLSYAWQMGANAWPQDKRDSFANDPLNLVVTVESVNSAKSDSSPASWLPPNKAIRCAYVTRFAEVALKYALPVTVADRQVMAAQCPQR